MSQLDTADEMIASLRAQVSSLTAENERLTRERDSLARRCAIRFEETEKLRTELEYHVRTISTLADDGSPYGGATLTGRWREVSGDGTHAG